MATYLPSSANASDTYVTGRGAAWFAFAMTLALMLFDYVDRQIIVSLFPHMKTEWGLSDKQLGALVSVVSVTVAVGALPIALFADRASRVKSIVAMATVWSLATISCLWARGYGALIAARALVGFGEAGYGSVGAALIASHFPSRMRGVLMAAFFASAAVGSVLGKANINIAGRQVGRITPGEEAIMVLNVDGEVSPEIMDEFRAKVGIFTAKFAKISDNLI